ncbi:MAG: TonB-dependent receptor [Tannerella sp.]|nr:TonB-dependent receptor [Tannerella sp.]
MRVAVFLVFVIIFQPTAASSYSQMTAFSVKENGIELTDKSRLETAQQYSGRQISGTVTDTEGQPVIGANVVEKGTTNGIMTDSDGKFSLSVSENAILSISYIGYIMQSVPVKSQTFLSITLVEDTQILDEVVVVGYGTAKKSDLTGSVVRADLATLQESPNVNLASALQGTIPGLNVGAVTKAGEGPDISIRGRTSISGGNSPLIVLDGIIFRGNLGDVNMNDVESIDVLKDASAAAIYGSQASNGVILITSKTGKVMSKPTIEYSGSFSYQQPTNKEMFPEGRDGYLRKIADRFLGESRMGDDLLQANPNWDVTKHFQGESILTGYNNGTDTNWWNLLTEDAPYIQNHNLSVRGKNELSSYYFSMGYTDQQNLIINDTYKRYSVRVNLDTDVTKWFKVGVQSFFTVSDYSGIAPAIVDVIGLPPLAAVSDENGDYIKLPYLTTVNPMLQIQQDDVDKRYNLFANFYADIDIPFIEGLNYRLNFSQNLIEGKDFNYNAQGSNFTGTASKMNSSQYNWTADNILSYKRTFGKHAINATFVYGVEKRQYEDTKAGASNFQNGVLGFNMLEAGQADLQTAESGAWEESSLYTMLRAIYTFNSRYIFTGTIRRDGFSGFGEKHKFGVFPSGAFAWRINEEDFFKERIDWVENLKWRLSYGANGNRTIGRYQTLAQLGSGIGYLFGDGASAEQIQWIKSLANADLRWETTKTFNTGIDFSMLNGRIFGNVDYYISRTSNLLFNINIPQINGLSQVPSNIGKLSNKGLELSVTGVPVQTKDFSWDITFNFSRNRNKVVSILGIDADNDGREDDLIANKIFIGHPYGVCYDYNLIGMWQIADKLAGLIPNGFEYGTYKVEDVNNDGKYTADKDRKILGYTEPAYRFSIQNTVNYKNWELKFFINSIQGGKDSYYGQPGTTLKNPENIYQTNLFRFDYWTPENPNARYRQLGYYTEALGYQYSPYIQRSFVRLQDVTLSYNVPSAWLKKFQVNRLKLYLSGKNLLTFTDWDGWDPETGAGLETSQYPVMRSYSIGLNLEF